MTSPTPPSRWPVADRSVLTTVLGVQPLTAVGLATVATALGVLADLTRIGSLGLVFTVCYLTGCVLATAWVRRSGLFWPMVAPPLLLAAAVPVVVLLAGSPAPGAGIAARLLVIGAPLVNAFPIMALTTGLVLALGIARIALQRTADPRRGSRAPGEPRPASPPEADTRRGSGAEPRRESPRIPRSTAEPQRASEVDPGRVSERRGRGAPGAAPGATRR